MGVWIETWSKVLPNSLLAATVTPFVGVWIETWCFEVEVVMMSGSHPSWVCGLKLSFCRKDIRGKRVTPFVGVWIETYEISWIIAKL